MFAGPPRAFGAETFVDRRALMGAERSWLEAPTGMT
jgi:hypothetical protein